MKLELVELEENGMLYVKNVYVRLDGMEKNVIQKHVLIIVDQMVFAIMVHVYVMKDSFQLIVV